MNPIDLFSALPDMAVFARVVDAGNFSVAARQLGSTPSTISRQIKRLEQQLGTQLLERSTRKVRVTESGQEVYRHCRDLVNAGWDALDAAGQIVARPRGRVSLSAPTAFAKSVIHPLIPGFLHTHPDVDVQLLFDDRERDPLDRDLDLVIRLTDAPPPGLAGKRLGVAKWVLCASPAYLASRGVPQHPHDLAEHDCIYLGETPDDHRWRLSRGSDIKTIGVHGRYIANHTGARLEAAQLGLGIANLPEYVARASFETGDVVAVLPDWNLVSGPYMGEIWLLYPPNRFLPPKVRVLIDYLTAHLDGFIEAPRTDRLP